MEEQMPVMDVASGATGEESISTPTPEIESTPSPASAPSDNPIPYSRVKQMREQWEAQKSREIAAERDRIKQYEDYFKGTQSKLMQAFGLEREKAPTYIDSDRYTQDIQNIQNSFREELERRELKSQALAGWKEVSTKYSDWASVPGFKEAVFNAWGADPSAEMADVGAKVADAYEKHYASREARKATEYAAKKESAPKVVKSGSGAGSPPRDGSGKFSVRSAIRRSLSGE
jgi:hypothetical protein